MFDIFNTVFKYKEKSSPDKLGVYPERVHVKAMPERRYLWLSRALVIMSVFSICLNMVLASTIYLLLPSEHSSPQLLYINDTFNQIQMLQPSEIDVPVNNLVTESQIQDYIMYRYLVTSRYDELASRWAPGSAIYWMSSNLVYKEFEENEAQLGLTLQRLRGLQRDVEIDWITQIARGVWQVQFRTLDYYSESKEPDISIWRAIMRISYADIPFPDRSYALRNPFGFLVTNYSLAYHGKPAVSDHYLDEARRIARKRKQR